MLPIPGCCWLCLMPLALHQQGICSACYRQLPERPAACPRCGLPAAHAHSECGRCLQRPPPWQTLVAVGDYQPPLTQLVAQLKFHRRTALSVMLARLILLSWLEQRRKRPLIRPHLVLPVPLHQRRAWQRGFNQTELLARARRRNLRGAFSLEIPVRGRHIALVDDVVTTGNTVGEISRLLLAAGAASVQICCLCRTL